ncbi:hypothetical protein [Treponema sp.]|uniref:hypothetical protein n=1 Tax=Treponema sp. TaxID=166 RepID=UPI00298E3B61|nr:hypothetical protein [Treponema sp.]MCR5612919.1 hypothetical protein [Treponema sp.]
MAAYMSLEFAHAYQGVINFFHDDCDCDIAQIPLKYKERFNNDFQKLQPQSQNKIDIQDILHYQRRMLNDFFYELEMCRESSFFLRNKIRKEWTTNEAWVVKILIYMNKVVDSDPELFKDISSIKHDHMPKTRGLSKHLEKFYNALKSEKRYIQI